MEKVVVVVVVEVGAMVVVVLATMLMGSFLILYSVFRLVAAYGPHCVEFRCFGYQMTFILMAKLQGISLAF